MYDVKINPHYQVSVNLGDLGTASRVNNLVISRILTYTQGSVLLKMIKVGIVNVKNMTDVQ